MVQHAETSDLSLPRILCLHGGGSNARIFRAQCRVITSHLRGRFRLCFADAPLPSKPGPDVLSVYEGWGPYRAWLPPAWIDGIPDREMGQVDAAITLVEDVIESTMEADNLSASGPWVGIMGFSQGAKTAASVLLRQQLQLEVGAVPRFSFKFGVILAGRGPLVTGIEGTFLTTSRAIRKANLAFRGHRFGEAENEREDAGNKLAGLGNTRQPIHGHVEPDQRLHIPTTHVHGLGDPGLQLHRRLREEWCEPNSTRLLEWDGGHRIPIKAKDVAVLVDHILRMAEASGVQCVP
ncbi:Esterase [Pleurostoma richardsiae]|uniref:Esterase n=1 Tax=Pleurostoma richardsiae TaxID=41990 RepID=A0AA38RHT3_9PEZI|nr:Esterase [Pleurostoma richardsiae]